MSIGNCISCIYWSPSIKSGIAEVIQSKLPGKAVLSTEGRDRAVRGQCRRHAPTPSAITTVWMTTKPRDWCGDFSQFDKGQISNRDIVDADDDLLEARNAYDDAQSDLRRAILAFRLATGTMRVGDDGRWGD